MITVLTVLMDLMVNQAIHSLDLKVWSEIKVIKVLTDDLVHQDLEDNRVFLVFLD